MRRTFHLAALCITLAAAAPAAGYDTATEDFSACLYGHGKLPNAAVVDACTRLIDNAATENEIVGYSYATRAAVNDDKQSNCRDARKAKELLKDRKLDENLNALIKINCQDGEAAQAPSKESGGASASGEDWTSCREAKRFADRVAACERIVANGKLGNKDLATAYTLLGTAYRRQDDVKSALASYDKAVALNPKDPEGYRSRGSLLLSLKELDKAAADFSRSIDLRPTDPVVHFWRGRLYAERAQFDEAIADFTRAIKLEPKKDYYYDERGRAYHAKGDYDKAVADYDAAIALKPQEDSYYYFRGKAHRELGNTDQALADYDKAIALRPKFADIYYHRAVNRGTENYHRRSFQRAIDDLDIAIALDPDYADAYHNRGMARLQTRDYDQAIADFDKAIALRPDDADGHLNRGIAHTDRGDYAKAVADYGRVIALRPDAAGATTAGRGPISKPAKPPRGFPTFNARSSSILGSQPPTTRAGTSWRPWDVRTRPLPASARR